MRTITLLLVMGFVLGACAGKPAPRSESPADGEAAPDFTVDTFGDGTFALREQRGNVVVLNFFESW